jgi:hypothetical protein
MSATARCCAWLALVVPCAVLLGCSYSREPSNANLTESKAISRRLAALPGVVRVDGGYARDLENPGSANFSISVRRTADLRTVAGAAVAAIWRSGLDPISSASVFVGLNRDSSVSVERHIDFTFDKAKLERRYGPRP